MIDKVLRNSRHPVPIKITARPGAYQRGACYALHHRIRIVYRADPDRQINSIRKQIFNTVGKTKIQRDFRIKRQQLRNERKDMQTAECRGCCDPDQAGYISSAAGQLSVRFVHFFKKRLGAVIVFSSLIRQRHAASASVEQQHTKPCFQGADRFADSGLRIAKSTCGGRKTACFHDRDESS